MHTRTFQSYKWIYMRYSKELGNNLNSFPTTVFACSWKAMIVRKRTLFPESRQAFLYLQHQQYQKVMELKLEKIVLPLYYFTFSVPFVSLIYWHVREQILYFFPAFPSYGEVDFEVKGKDWLTFRINLMPARLWTQCFGFLKDF